MPTSHTLISKQILELGERRCTHCEQLEMQSTRSTPCAGSRTLAEACSAAG